MNVKLDPKQRLTYAEYKCFPNDGQRHEIIDGGHYVNPVPSTYHQTVSRRIQFELYQQIELKGLGVVYDAPVDLQLGDADIVQPDLVVVLTKHMQMITPTKIKGVPDLVVEIISPSSDENDRVLKRSLYQRSGVPEYWIVDPAEHVVDQLVLQDGQYVSVDRTDVVVPTILRDVTVDLAKVW